LTPLARWSTRAGDAVGFLAHAHVHPKPARTPLVSVVIATYNWSSVLRHAIRSSLWQTYPQVEVIVVGDACTDDSEQVVRAFGDERVRWDNLERNSGSQSLPNNRGLELAQGEYVAYLGHDDLWLPTHLVHLVAAIERSGAGSALSGIESIGPPGSNVLWFSVRSPAPSALLHRRDLGQGVGGWRDFRTIVEPPDREFIARLETAEGLAQTRAITVCKFNSAWRPGSYTTRRDDEQRAYAERIARERLFVERELAARARLMLTRKRPSLPDFGPVPDVVPPGWHVRQYRRVRGLAEDPENAV